MPQEGHKSGEAAKGEKSVRRLCRSGIRILREAEQDSAGASKIAGAKGEKEKKVKHHLINLCNVGRTVLGVGKNYPSTKKVEHFTNCTLARPPSANAKVLRQRPGGIVH